ncbi:Protein NRT1/ PTR FAMILY 5.4, partial [Bienertia sinuspersici]
MDNNINNDNTQIHSSKGGWKSAIFIICKLFLLSFLSISLWVVEMAERFAYYGIAANLMMYLTKELDQPLATAATNVNTWNGVSSLALLIGAFFADSYLGRFNTTLASSCLFLMGLIMLTISTSSKIPPNIHTPLFFSALYVTAVGEGGHKPCVQTFAADQFDENTPEEKTAKSSFFNWWYLGIVVGATTAVLVVTYVQDNISWTIGFGIPTIAVGLALIVFMVGHSTYREARPVGSPFTSMAQVVVAAIQKRRVSETNNIEGPWYGDDVVSGLKANKLVRTQQF